jgi:hypothetical protein
VANASIQKVFTCDLMDLAISHDPTMTADADTRRRILTAIMSLVDNGTLTVPAGKTHWDDREQPPLPKWVQRVTVKHAKPAVRKVWPAALSAAGEEAKTSASVAILEQVAQWLPIRPDKYLPTRERSLEIFGEDKRLEKLLTSSMFVSGGLDHDFFRTFSVPIPFVSQFFPGVNPAKLLVCENVTTYFSVCAAVEALPHTEQASLHIGWGSGASFSKSIGSVTWLNPAVTAVEYFGDLDEKGVQIPVQANNASAKPQGVTITPCVPLYELLLTHGRPLTGQPATTIGNETMLWFGPEINQQVSRLLSSGQTLVQEWVNRDILTDTVTTWAGIKD